MTFIKIAILSYLIGNISGSYLIGKIFLNKDVRKYGSGNAGTTNAFRVLGIYGGLGTFLIDFMKGILLVVIIKKFFGLTYIPFAIFFGILGHDFPFYMKFKGGKGMAMTLGAFTTLSIKLTIIPYFIWLITVLITGYVSLGSLLFFVSLAIFYILFGNLGIFSTVFIILISAIGIIRHNSNIKRLIEGNENKIGGKK